MGKSKNRLKLKADSSSESISGSGKCYISNLNIDSKLEQPEPSILFCPTSFCKLEQMQSCYSDKSREAGAGSGDVIMRGGG